MAYAFVTPNGTATAGNASGGALSLTKPSGVADGHLMVVGACLEDDTASWTAPAGWNTHANLVQTNPAYVHIQIFWKIAASEPSSWTWTPSITIWRTLVLSTYSGALGSGERFDVAGGNQGDAVGEPAQTAPSIDTTVDGDLVNFLLGSRGSIGDSVLGFCSNQRVTLGSTKLADAPIKDPAGATGTSTNHNAGTISFAALHSALFLTGTTSARRFLLHG